MIHLKKYSHVFFFSFTYPLEGKNSWMTNTEPPHTILLRAQVDPNTKAPDSLLSPIISPAKASDVTYMTEAPQPDRIAAQ